MRLARKHLDDGVRRQFPAGRARFQRRLRPARAQRQQAGIFNIFAAQKIIEDAEHVALRRLPAEQQQAAVHEGGVPARAAVEAGDRLAHRAHPLDGDVARLRGAVCVGRADLGGDVEQPLLRGGVYP